MKIVIAFFSFILFAAPLAAQGLNIQGRVVDEEGTALV